MSTSTFNRGGFCSREERQPVPYSGTMISDLQDSVDRVAFLDHAEACIRGLYPPELYLANVLTHLAIRAATDESDGRAYVICYELQQLIIRPELGLPCFSFCPGCGIFFVHRAVGEMREYMRTNFWCGPCDGEDYS